MRYYNDLTNKMGADTENIQRLFFDQIKSLTSRTFNASIALNNQGCVL